MNVAVSDSVRRACGGVPQRSEWLRALPRLVTEVSDSWGITLGASLDGATCSFVAKVRRSDRSPAVLKLAMPHFEGEHEIDGLLFWDGDATVRVLEFDRKRHAMLLEYCPGSTAIEMRSEDEQDVVIARLLRRLWRTPPPSHPFRLLSDMIARWCVECRGQAAQWPDPKLVQEGLDAFEELAQGDTWQTLLATDLHAGNVLRAGREPWLVIDPKPFVGDPAYDATQHLLNCRERLTRDASGAIRRFADMLGVDADRVRQWLFARLAAEPRDDWSDTDSINLARALAL